MIAALLIILGLLVLLALTGAVYEARAEAADRRRFPPPGQIVSAGGEQLHLLALGERQPGQPVVVLESGPGNGSLAWRSLQPEVARFARAVAYDRAGLGWSGSAAGGAGRRTPERMVTALHAALAAAGEPGPYALVGHAMGATLARLFAARYPRETAALVLIDPSHEQLERWVPSAAQALARLGSRARIAAWLARVGAIRLAGQRVLLERPAADPDPEVEALLASQVLTPRFFAALAEECAAFARPDAWQALPPTHGDLLTVLVAPAAEDQPGWRAIHEDLLGRSTRSHRMPVEGGDLLAGQSPAVLAAIQTAVEVAALRPAEPAATEVPSPGS
jgi:pimeloyl-ACP methyl ester carboxylesterase